MGCYLSWRCLVLVLCLVYSSMFLTSSGCFMEERAALMDISSWLVRTSSEVPSSWGHGDDCCSWEKIFCDNSTRRIFRLHFFQICRSTPTDGSDGSTSVAATDAASCLNLKVFSSFRELQILEFAENYACLQNFEGLQGLSKLKYLNLSDNSFKGSIQGSISKLVSLEFLNLNRNNVNGSLQNTGLENLRNLRELHLGYNQLSGSLPASVFALPCLEHLDLSENLFHGHIPINSSWKCSSLLRTIRLSGNMLSGKFDFFWLRNCTKLKDIVLSRNTDLVVHVKLHGWVPKFHLKILMLSWCNLDKSMITEPDFLRTQRHLEFLDLSNNNLPGNMPNWLFTNEARLIYLDLSNNSLVGSLDPILQQQTNLEVMNISRNHVEGQLPANMSSVFPGLAILDISHNIISGVVPSSFCQISISVMDLSNNKLTGEAPSCLFNSSFELTILKLSNNSLGGKILDGVSNLVNLLAIYLDNNQFEGTIARNLYGFNVQVMDFHGNKFSGELDTSSWFLPGLKALSLASNSLTGDIHPGICQLWSLRLLDLSDNYFIGIPNCSYTLQLQSLSISGNSLSGFPNAIFNSSYITALDLSNNQFTGNLEWTKYLSQVSILLLSRNKFEGHISSSLCHLQHLSIIDISHNILSGSIPPCIGDIPFEDPESDAYKYDWPSIGTISLGGLSEGYISYNGHYELQGFTFTTKGNPYTYGRNFFMSMSGIDLSANNLSGEIPREIGNLSHIKSLNLSSNFLTGPIPATLANMSEMESLDLSENRLNGPIPWQLTRLSSLEVFSVAYNNLSGCRPDTGQFGAFDMDSYIGNTNLRSCTSSSTGPVAWNGSTVGDVPGDSDPILYVVSAVSFVLAFWATVAFVFFHSFGQRVLLKL